MKGLAVDSVFDGVQMGTGTWQWGDTIFWNYDKAEGEQKALAAFDRSLDLGITLLDTAEIYGMGVSEKIIGKAIMAERLRSTPRPFKLASKYAPLPHRITRAQFRAALKRTRDRLTVHSLDLYQIHWTNPIVPEEFFANLLAEALDEGSISAAGVSNYNRAQVIRSHHTLTTRGHTLASNQVEFHLLQRRIERDGTFEACRERGIRVIAYSPLAMGLLTGKYTPENPPPGMRGRKYAAVLPKIAPLIGLMREIGAKHGDKSPAQVALNWVIGKGALPIPGAKNADQVEKNSGALGWSLSDDDMAALDAMSDRVTR